MCLLAFACTLLDAPRSHAAPAESQLSARPRHNSNSGLAICRYKDSVRQALRAFRRSLVFEYVVITAVLTVTATVTTFYSPDSKD